MVAVRLDFAEENIDNRLIPKLEKWIKAGYKSS